MECPRALNSASVYPLYAHTELTCNIISSVCPQLSLLSDSFLPLKGLKNKLNLNAKSEGGGTDLEFQHNVKKNVVYLVLPPQ